VLDGRWVQAQEEKAGLAQKLESLKAMAAQLEQFDPEWESREKGECEALNLVRSIQTAGQGCLPRLL
jgi:hypothetical protein